MFACDTKTPETVTLLLEKGATARATDYEGKSAIDHYKKNTSYNNPVPLQELEKATEGW